MKMQAFRLAVGAVGFLLLVAHMQGCAAPPDPRADRRFNAVSWVRDAAEYRLAARQAYRLARTQLHAGLADETWTADEMQKQAGCFQKKRPAVVLDLDETVLNNSAYSAQGMLQGTEYSTESWNAWVNEEQAELVPGARKFVEYATRSGVKVFFVTNRTDDLRDATLANLKSLGLPSDPQCLLTRNDNDGRPGDKISRRATIAEQHRIVLLIGDSMGDFCAGMQTRDQHKRKRVADKRGKMLGTRWIIIPNPMYGDWEQELPNGLETGGSQNELETAVQEAHRDTVSVGSWNIEHLGNPQARFGDAQGISQSPTDLADEIEHTHCDVLALQELYVTTANRQCEAFDDVVEILNARGGSWTYRLFENRDPFDGSQVTGIAWNQAHVTLADEPFRVPIVDDSSEFFEWDRHPHAVKFSAGRGRTDFVVVPLHMKAGTSQPNLTQRNSEAAMLVRQLDSIRSTLGDGDLILIGDTNIATQGDRASLIYEDAGLRDLLESGQSTVTFAFRAFDRAFVATESIELTQSRQEVFDVPAAYREEYRRRHSDHYPIAIRITVSEDDD